MVVKIIFPLVNVWILIISIVNTLRHSQNISVLSIDVQNCLGCEIIKSLAFWMLLLKL